MGHLALRAVLGDVQRVDGAGHHAVDFGLSIGFCLFVAIAVDLQRVGVVLQAGAQGPARWRFRSTLLPFSSSQVGGLAPQAGAFDKVTGTKAAVMAASVCAEV